MHTYSIQIFDRENGPKRYRAELNRWRDDHHIAAESDSMVELMQMVDQILRCDYDPVFKEKWEKSIQACQADGSLKVEFEK